MTLVHGTASCGGWYRLFEERLRDEVGSRLSFEHLRWSGWLSMGARRKASRRFVEFMKEAIARHPDAIHHIVAHSHGGNIVLNAYPGELPLEVERVICLSTPFLVVSQRSASARIPDP